MVIGICVAFFIVLVAIAITNYRIGMDEDIIDKLVESHGNLKIKVNRGEQYLVFYDVPNAVFPREVPLNVVIRALVDHLGLELNITPAPNYNGLVIKKKEKGNG